MMERKQKATLDGLEAEREAKINEQVIHDYKNIMRCYINPAREAEGLSIKQI